MSSRETVTATAIREQIRARGKRHTLDLQRPRAPISYLSSLPLLRLDPSMGGRSALEGRAMEWRGVADQAGGKSSRGPKGLEREGHCCEENGAISATGHTPPVLVASAALLCSVLRCAGCLCAPLAFRHRIESLRAARPPHDSRSCCCTLLPCLSTFCGVRVGGNSTHGANPNAGFGGANPGLAARTNVATMPRAVSVTSPHCSSHVAWYLTPSI